METIKMKKSKQFHDELKYSSGCTATSLITASARYTIVTTVFTVLSAVSKPSVRG